MNDNFCMGNLVNLNIISSGFNLGRPSLSIFQSLPFVSFPFCLQYFAGTYYCMSLSFPPLLTASVFDSLFNFSSVFDSCSPTASVKNYFIPNLPSPHLASTTQSQWIRCQTHLPPKLTQPPSIWVSCVDSSTSSKAPIQSEMKVSEALCFSDICWRLLEKSISEMGLWSGRDRRATDWE